MLDLTTEDLADPIQFLADSAYGWGSLQAIRYDRTRTDLFPEPYLATLYRRAKESGGGRIGPLGILPQTFCGMRDLSCEAVTSYLHQIPVVVVGEWQSAANTIITDEESGSVEHRRQPPQFYPLGFCYPSTALALADPQHQTSDSPPANSVFAGYGFFDDAWGTPAQTVLMFLGLAYLFAEFRLAAIHGSRYHDNHLTARWCRRFGFRDVGTLDYHFYRRDTGLLGPGVVSTLRRENFADILRRALAASQQE